MDHLTMLLDVSPPDMVTIAYEEGFDSVSLRVSASAPRRRVLAHERWISQARGDHLQARRYQCQGAQRVGYPYRPRDTKREDYYEPALESAAMLGAR